MGKKNNPAQNVIDTAKTAYGPTQTPSDQEKQVSGLGSDVGGVYRQVTGQNLQDYGNLMKGYGDIAQTGGYSDQDIQNLRARGVAPVRAAYGDTMMQLDRARALGGGGANAPNYIAAVSKAQRQLPQQMSDALTGVNANLAQMVQQGKLAGLSGMGQTYAAAPGLSNSFASQYGNLQNLQGNLLAQRQSYGLGLLGAQLGGYQANQGQQGSPWWQTMLGIAGTAAPFVAMSDRNVKKDIKRVDDPIRDGLRKLPLYTWKYKGDNVTHMGPMAQDFRKRFGVGDGKTIHLADVMGVMIGAAKEAYA
jgi:hypothetical protein